MKVLKHKSLLYNLIVKILIIPTHINKNDNFCGLKHFGLFGFKYLGFWFETYNVVVEILKIPTQINKKNILVHSFFHTKNHYLHTKKKFK